MKALILKNVIKNLNTLMIEYAIKDKLNYNLLEKYLDIAKKSNVNVSYANFESAIAILYLLKTYGIPVKSSARILEADSKKIFKLIKLMDKNILKEDNHKKFIDFLLKDDTQEFREKFILIYEKIVSSFSDRMLLIISIFGLLKKTELGGEFMFKENLYGYSEFTVRQKRQEIKDAIK